MLIDSSALLPRGSWVEDFTVESPDNGRSGLYSHAEVLTGKRPAGDGAVLGIARHEASLCRVTVALQYIENQGGRDDHQRDRDDTAERGDGGGGHRSDSSTIALRIARRSPACVFLLLSRSWTPRIAARGRVQHYVSSARHR